MPAAPPEVHAYSAASNLGQALSTIPLVRPRTKRIVAILDRTPVNRERADKLRDLATKMAPGISVDIWNEYTEEDLYRRAISLNRNEDAILLFPVLAFPDGRQAVPAEVARKLSQAAAVPVFSHFDTLLGTGIVGGYMVSGRALGHLIGELAAFGDRRVPASQESYAAASMGYYFDGRALRRWGIDRAALPEESRILFDDKTFLERHGLLIGLIVLVFIAETVLVLSLISATRRLRFAMGALTEERAHLEERVQERTAEKELLLKELQHRVKNSMALITSLVRLEAAGIEDPGAVEALDALDSRIAALATLYDTLWSSGEVTDIDLGAYLGRILADLDRSLGADARNVAFVPDLQPLRFDTKRGIPVGLITNELITNSLKRAFPDGRSGSISVRLRVEGESAVLEVADNGVGLPLDFDPDLSGGFGMRLIQVLCAQLGADFTYCDARPGAQFTIRIPYRRSA